MLQKIIWMRCLLTGTAISIMFLFTSCQGDVDYRLDADIIFINETNHLINYYHYDNSKNFRQLAFELSPNSEKKYEIRSNGSDTNIDDCCQGILEDIQGAADILIDYNNSERCLIYLSGDGSTTANINVAYERREISSKYYEFIYRFIDEEYEQAEGCN